MKKKGIIISVSTIAAALLIGAAVCLIEEEKLPRAAANDARRGILCE